MTVDKHSTHEQLHYFDTTSFEPPDEDDNILLCMNNTISIIPDNDGKPLSTSNNTMNITPAISYDDDCVIVHLLKMETLPLSLLLYRQLIRVLT